MNELALFAGVLGGGLGSQLLGHRIICAVEQDPYCQEVLSRRQEEGFLPAFPIWNNVYTFDGKPWRGKVDLLSAGFPCQSFSVAGKRQSDMSMFRETCRIIREVRPPLVFLENVQGLYSAVDSNGDFVLGRILKALAFLGYDTAWCRLGADDCNAPHHRKRIWILAYTRSIRGRRRADTRPRKSKKASNNIEKKSLVNSWPWQAEPRLGRVVDGVPYWVDRLKALGNAQVPVVAARAFQMLMDAITEN